ncbi:KEOPS complex subunit Pcc1 [Methanotrichaceae archaeon M04Ac]|uniref:KEOPS complex subunit Pcc1 n=1 Tax=Candidatus Methanocrinis alkalitolerans TaxID=3033395 RepID=A0ABT5XCV2_9EURY|nr:KEOPS complex subunit Pcc1 [Candidatus Methanocrinis alkalitolerans]MCR3883497.1 KEOPS complex subunit Pcc1 [Methanothrix sp.]MDF0592522.1 KEOPS complex subunit Pcc1 [Candidatus Methanocrinis alkalitolerans]
MKGIGEIVFEVEDPERVMAALAPEAEDQVQKSEISLHACEEGLLLRIESDDVVSFRAAMNTWIRLVDIALDMVKV